MKVGQRIDTIKKVCHALDQSSFVDSNLVLRSFGCSTYTEFPYSNYEYYIDRVEGLETKFLVELYDHLFPGEPLPASATLHKSSLWKDGYLKAFISHSTKQKLLATQIRKEAADFGIDCFVAHEDIEATKEWLREIRYGLASCDCVIALLTNDFRESNFCDQEIGFSLQRGVLVVPISIEINPYGFMAPFQRITAFDKSPSEIVEEIRSIVLRTEPLDEIAEAGIAAYRVHLVQTFLASSNYGDSSALLRKIEEQATIPKNLLRLMSDNYLKNDQIYGCFGIPARMKALFAKHRFDENEK